MTPARKQLVAQAKAYVDSVRRDYEAAQSRFDRARRILAHVAEGKPAAECPTPELNETSAQADRFAARVDALLMACFTEETGEV